MYMYVCMYVCMYSLVHRHICCAFCWQSGLLRGVTNASFFFPVVSLVSDESIICVCVCVLVPGSGSNARIRIFLKATYTSGLRYHTLVA